MQNANALNSYLTIRDLATMLNISKAGIYGLCKEGFLPQGIKIGKCRRWAVKDIQSYLDSLSKGQPA